MTKKAYIFKMLPVACQAAGEGKLHFEQRQVFYAIRPGYMEQFGEEPNYQTFTQAVTEYEAKRGPIPNLVRDARGYIYDPHTRTETPLGTVDVARYSRPQWTFNKVLYIEKQGFVSALRQINWPERNDCALMTSKGQSCRAAKDLVDGLADTDEPCRVFCLHDADGYGTRIYHAFQEGTEARGRRRFEIVNLGLDPAEGRAMGLQVESFEPKCKVQVGDYVPPDDREWLQTNRIELNAMTTPQFVAWLDAKMSHYEGKVIPPDDVLKDKFDETVQIRLRSAIEQAILDRYNIDDLLDGAMDDLEDAYDEAIESLRDEVAKRLRINPIRLWDSPVEQIATKLVDEWDGPTL
jgi:hypothetical protein